MSTLFAAGKRSLTYWLAGLSGAGKTNLAKAFADAPRAQNQAICVLDGDDLRQGLSNDFGFSTANSKEQCHRTAEMARLLNHNGILAIVALISPTKVGRAIARQIIGASHMREIYLATPLAVCRQRDVNGLYAKAASEPAMLLTGVQSSYEVPDAPDCVIDTSTASINESLSLLISLHNPLISVFTSKLSSPIRTRHFT